MKQRINIFTFAVSDLTRSMKFYRDGMALETKGIVGTEFDRGSVVFFDLINGMKLALYERKNLAWDSCLPDGLSSPIGFSIGHLVNSRNEIDEIMHQAKEAGAKISKPAKKTFWGGYACYFQDPDDHLWEIVYNPSLKIAE